MPSDITGVSLLTGHGEFTFRRGPLFADVVLGDEINRAPAKTQAAMLEAMQERSVTVDGTTYQLSPSFAVFATQNPIEFEGTYPLPEAELDRFLVKTILAYPDESSEQGLLGRVLEGFEAAEPESYGVSALMGAEELAAVQRAVRRVRVRPPILAYITTVVRATREAPALTLGASPRASVALLMLAQASALLEGRDYVVPDDVKALAAPVLRHRVVVAPELELEGVTADAAVQGIVDQVPAPRG
jgi:MoxR-like ATPase